MGESYSVSSPSINGYTPNQATVEGAMPARDVQITVFYMPQTTNPAASRPVAPAATEAPMKLSNVCINAGECIE